MIRNLRIWQKLALIGIAFSLPILVLLYLLVAEKSIAIDFARKEMDGDRYLRSLRTLLELLPEYERLGAVGVSPSSPEVAQLSAQIAQAFGTLDTLDAQLGAGLQTTDRLHALERQWRDRPPDAHPVELHGAFIVGIRELITQAGDSSNLILDPDLDSYYTMDSVLLKLPEHQDLLARAIRRGERIIAGKTLDTDEKTQFIVWMGLLDSNLEATRNGMRLALGNNPSGSLAAVQPEVQRHIAATRRFLDLLRRRVIEPQTIELESAEYIAGARGALAASFALWDASTRALDVLLQARIDGFNRRTYAALAAIALVMTLTILLVISIVRSIVRPVTAISEATGRLARHHLPQLAKVANAIANGELSHNVEVHLDTIPVTTRDEIGQMTGSFNMMTERLNEISATFQRMFMSLAEARNAALESTRLKSQFLANMSHEIRTPMNGVVGMTGLLLESGLNREQREYAETIRTSADAMLTLINDILDFSKIEAGQLHFERLDFDLRGAVEGTTELLAEQGQRKGVELVSIVHPDVPASLRGDPGRLRQVLTNLVANGLKFSQRGDVVITVTREKAGETDTHAVVRFAIRDTGIGISEAAQARLFQAFTQADGSTTRKYGGTGLGLAICKQLVKCMDGEIGVVSTPGQGSTFWFTAKFEKQTMDGLDSPAQTGVNGLRVLVVDDSEGNRTVIHDQAAWWGMSGGSAASGKDALEMLRHAAALHEAYDLAVIDMDMPGMDGLALALAVKGDPTIAATKLVVMTARGNRAVVEPLLAAGVAATLSKPIKQSQLFDCLVRAAGGQTDAAPEEDTPTGRFLETSQPSHSTRILLAEDNAVNQKVAIRQLQKLGYAADAVGNGREVLEALSSLPYDIVLMDCQMPEMDGYEATAEIRRREGSAKHTVIIAITANAMEGDRERCDAAGMDDFVTKPIKQSDLAAVVDRWRLRLDASAVAQRSASDPDAPRSLRAIHW